jgi:uncharacterized damage-inducible protein DinB
MNQAASARDGIVLRPPMAVRPHAVLMQLLEELAAVLRPLSQTAYTATPFPAVSSSIGQHVRHVLDHVACVCGAASDEMLSYDRRERGTSLEADVNAALDAIRKLKCALAALESRCEHAPVTLTTTVARETEPVRVGSTLGRELLFVISHTVHHQALIALLLSAAGRSVPEAFGFAPSTPRFARS